MKPETITALLALWRRLPECRPQRLFNTPHPSSFAVEEECSDGASIAATPTEASALAADAIERWMLGKHGPFEIQTYHDGVRFGSLMNFCMFRIHTSLMPTKLDCLISAANAVLDAEGMGT